MVHIEKGEKLHKGELPSVGGAEQTQLACLGCQELYKNAPSFHTHLILFITHRWTEVYQLEWFNISTVGKGFGTNEHL